MIQAKISTISSNDDLNIVEFECLEHKFTMLSLQLSSDIKIGSLVVLNIKPTHVSLAKNDFISSIDNKIKVKIKSINEGELLRCFLLDLGGDFTLEAITTKKNSNNFFVDDEVFALINASEISILKVIE